jgi:hypothetical protein
MRQNGQKNSLLALQKNRFFSPKVNHSLWIIFPAK